MSENPSPGSETGPVHPTPQPTTKLPSMRKAWYKRPWVIALASFVVGVGIGNATASSGSEPVANVSQAEPAPTVTVTVDPSAQRQAELDQREKELAVKEAELQSREAAVSTEENQEAANAIGEGVWTVGVDVAQGTYRVKEAVTTDCYWSITNTGTNGEDIIQNDIVTGGRPQVTLKKGQDFKNQGCGDWVKVG